MNAVPKHSPLRDRKYLLWLRSQRCEVTGSLATHVEAVEPAHIGTTGVGIKSPDNEAIPLCHTMHGISHRIGFAQFIRQFAPNELIVAAFRAYARERHQRWRAQGGRQT